MKKKIKRKVKKTEEVKTVKRVNTKRIIWTLIIIIAIMVIVILALIFREHILVEWNRAIGNIFEWKGMTWYKHNYNGLKIYSAELAIYQSVEIKPCITH